MRYQNVSDKGLDNDVNTPAFLLFPCPLEVIIQVAQGLDTILITGLIQHPSFVAVVECQGSCHLQSGSIRCNMTAARFTVQNASSQARTLPDEVTGYPGLRISADTLCTHGIIFGRMRAATYRLAPLSLLRTKLSRFAHYSLFEMSACKICELMLRVEFS